MLAEDLEICIGELGAANFHGIFRRKFPIGAVARHPTIGKILISSYKFLKYLEWRHTAIIHAASRAFATLIKQSPRWQPQLSKYLVHRARIENEFLAAKQVFINSIVHRCFVRFPLRLDTRANFKLNSMKISRGVGNFFHFEISTIFLNFWRNFSDKFLAGLSISSLFQAIFNSTSCGCEFPKLA